MAADQMALATHVLVDFMSCDPVKLSDEIFLQEALEKAAREAGASIVKSVFKRFQPYGVSGVVLVKESHLTIHTWPEHGSAAVDIFLCGDRGGVVRAERSLFRALGAEKERVRSVDRISAP